MAKEQQRKYLSYRGGYFDLSTGLYTDTISKHIRATAVILGLGANKTHLNKFDSKQNFKYKKIINGKEFGISCQEIDIFYILDYIKIKNDNAYLNILLKTKYVSIALINGITVQIINHTEKEGLDSQFFSYIFNTESFIAVNLLEEYAKLISQTRLFVVAGFSFTLLIGLIFWAFQPEEIVIELETEGQRVQAQQDVIISLNARQIELLEKYRQYKFFTEIFSEYTTQDLQKLMFEYIGLIKINKSKGVYEKTSISLVASEGYERVDELFEKTTKLKVATDLRSKAYQEQAKDIVKNEFAYYKKLKYGKDYSGEMAYLEWLRKNDTSAEVERFSEFLRDVENQNWTRNLNGVRAAEIYLMSEYGFSLDSIKETHKKFKVTKKMTAAKMMSLLQKIVYSNIIIDKLVVKKDSITINSNIYSVSMEIILPASVIEDEDMISLIQKGEVR